MRKLLKIISKLQWLGILGLVGDLLGLRMFKLFYLFWLLAFVDLFVSARSTVNSLLFLLQNLAMLVSLPITPLLYKFRLPDKDTYVPQCTYSLPFAEKWHVANGGVDKDTSHSWYAYSQRYAYDFYITDGEENSHMGSREVLSNYYCYGKEVLAPADGVVVLTKDSYEDTPITEPGQVDCAASDVRGNHVVIQHNKNEYSTVAHLLKDSICVVKGDKVQRGQKIALCGNSGNTSEPHIHFQIQANKSFIFSAGIPVSFKDILVDGQVESSPCFITNGSDVQNIKPKKMSVLSK